MTKNKRNKKKKAQQPEGTTAIKPSRESGESGDIVIRFYGLYTYNLGESNTIKLPLSALDTGSLGHIHGNLEIIIGGRLMPYMGYFGPDDVCFGAWINELRLLKLEFDTSEAAVYVYDEGEQGQPAFRFDKNGDLVLFSITESEMGGGGSGDPDWQGIEFSYKQFVREYENFKVSFLAEVRREAPKTYPKWKELFDRQERW